MEEGRRRNTRPVHWVGTSRDDLRRFPGEVRETMGFALFQAQQGGRHVDARPLKGFGGAGVLEFVEDFRGEAFRTVYTVKLHSAVYVLHAFQKKSKKGIETPRKEIAKVKERLRLAIEHHREQYE